MSVISTRKSCKGTERRSANCLRKKKTDCTTPMINVGACVAQVILALPKGCIDACALITTVLQYLEQKRRAALAIETSA